MMKKINYALLISILVLSFSACEDDDDDVLAPPIPNEEEVITTLRFILTPDSGGQVASFIFQDLDGDGGNIPVITFDTLNANTSYTASVQFLNELENPAEDITVEVKEEDLEHQVFYDTDLSGLTITYLDQDPNGNPLGVDTKAETTSPESGTLTITLRHEPNKDAPGVSNGDITNAGGETDIEVSFPIVVR